MIKQYCINRCSKAVLILFICTSAVLNSTAQEIEMQQLGWIPDESGSSMKGVVALYNRGNQPIKLSGFLSSGRTMVQLLSAQPASLSPGAFCLVEWQNNALRYNYSGDFDKFCADSGKAVRVIFHYELELGGNTETRVCQFVPALSDVRVCPPAISCCAPEASRPEESPQTELSEFTAIRYKGKIHGIRASLIFTNKDTLPVTIRQTTCDSDLCNVWPWSHAPKNDIDTAGYRQLQPDRRAAIIYRQNFDPPLSVRDLEKWLEKNHHVTLEILYADNSVQKLIELLPASKSYSIIDQ